MRRAKVGAKAGRVTCVPYEDHGIKAMDETERLIGAYIDNELQGNDHCSLAEWLRADRAHVDHFIRACFLHWQLFAIGQRKSLQTNVEAMPRPARLREVRRAIFGPAHERSTRAQRASKRFARPMMAATLLVACGLAAWWVSRASQPATVAQLTRASADAAWDHQQAALAAGLFFHEGQLVRLTAGRILTTLSTGVQVVIQSPATVRMDSGRGLYLQTGRITVTVPRQASGFAVDSPIASFVDLGTDFTIDVKGDSACELHVFSGLIEMQPHVVRRIDRLRVPEGRAITYRADTGDVERLPFRMEEKLSL